jgi:2,5-diketo-D-gluconate reductase A
MVDVPTVTLSDGVGIPQLGFGTFQVPADDAQRAVEEALAIGYRHIDTAAIYGNEEGVGRALAASGLKRDEYFVTTKLWNNQHHGDQAVIGINASLERLALDFLDLYLIHWPAPVKYGDAYIEAWDALQGFQFDGLTRSIGVSNFGVEHLNKLSGAVPSINQIELHPTLTQPELTAELSRRGIVVEAWSPLGRGADLSEFTLLRIADDVDKTPAQVCIRWHLQLGHVVIPKSITPARIAENFNVFDFELSAEQVADISALNRDHRTGADPATADF